MAGRTKSPSETTEQEATGRRQILTVSAPAGPRRRNGFSFGPVPVDIPFSDLGDDAEDLIKAFRADPYLKVDGRIEAFEPEEPVAAE